MNIDVHTSSYLVQRLQPIHDSSAYFHQSNYFRFLRQADHYGKTHNATEKQSVQQEGRHLQLAILNTEIAPVPIREILLLLNIRAG